MRVSRWAASDCKLESTIPGFDLPDPSALPNMSRWQPLAEDVQYDKESYAECHHGKELRHEPDDYPRDRVDHVLHFLSSRATPVLPLVCFHPNVRQASAAKVRTKKLQAMRSEFTPAPSSKPIAKNVRPASIPSPRRKAKRGRPRHRERQGNECGSFAQSAREGRASRGVSLAAGWDALTIGRSPIPPLENRAWFIRRRL